MITDSVLIVNLVDNKVLWQSISWYSYSQITNYVSTSFFAVSDFYGHYKQNKKGVSNKISLIKEAWIICEAIWFAVELSPFQDFDKVI